MRLNLVVTRINDDEVAAMVAMAQGFGLRHHVFSNVSPTIMGSSRSLPTQSIRPLKARKPFVGCNAGHTFFHVDPHARVSICKVGRDPYIDLLTEGIDGLRRLGGIADSLLARQGAAAVAPSRAPVAPACRWSSSTAGRSPRWSGTASTAKEGK